MKQCTLTYVNNDKRLFIHSYCLSSLYCPLLKQNTSTLVFIIYQVTVAAFFVVVDSFEQILN